jgi:hypothetical protein
MAKFRGGLHRDCIDFWDRFEFVGNSFDGRVIWAVGQAKADSLSLGDGVLVVELHHEGELTPENLPDDAFFYFQYHLNRRREILIRRSFKSDSSPPLRKSSPTLESIANTASTWLRVTHYR